MAFVARLLIAGQVLIADAALAILWLYWGPEITGLMTGAHSGPWSPTAGWLSTVVPGVIGLIGLGTVVWLIYGAVQEERKRTVMRR